MEHTLESIEHDQHAGGGTKEIWRVTIILSVLTIIELALGYGMMKMSDESLGKHLIKGVILILMIAKAIYIVGYFMHLKHELRNMILTIVVPLFLFVWFIIAFLSDGNSFKNDKNRWDRGHKERSEQPMPKKEEGESTHKME